MKPATKFICAAGSGVSTLTSSIDTRGFSYCQIVASASITNGISGTAANTVLEESDNNSSWASVTTGLAHATTSAAVDVAKVVYNIDLRGRKRYLKPTVGLTATAGMAITAILHNGADAPVTAAEVNGTFVLNI